MIAALFFLSTLAHVPHALIMVAAALLIARRGFPWLKTPTTALSCPTFVSNLWILLAIVAASFINWLGHLSQIDSLSEGFPFFLLVPVTALCGFLIERRDIKILVLLIAFESIVGVAEYFQNVPTFIPGVEYAEDVAFKADLWYYNRVFGLSENSSVLAVKVFLAWLLMDFFKLRGGWYRAARWALVLGVFVTFNRSVIVALLSYVIVSTIVDRLRSPGGEWHHAATLLAAGLLMVGVSFLGFFYANDLLTQFTRDRGVDLSGRGAIWAFFFEFIGDHPLLGNGSIKVYTPLGKHAHNSFLQAVATNGILITLLYLWQIVRNLRVDNILAVAALLIYSMTQYGIFWGISLADLVLFAFLFQTSGKHEHAVESEQKLLASDLQEVRIAGS